MRDPKRLKPLYDRLEKVHELAVPDWRFGQLMMNMLGEYQHETGRDPFFAEDEEFIEFIEKQFHIEVTGDGVN